MPDAASIPLTLSYQRGGVDVADVYAEAAVTLHMTSTAPANPAATVPGTVCALTSVVKDGITPDSTSSATATASAGNLYDLACTASNSVTCADAKTSSPFEFTSVPTSSVASLTATWTCDGQTGATFTVTKTATDTINVSGTARSVTVSWLRLTTSTDDDGACDLSGCMLVEGGVGSINELQWIQHTNACRCVKDE